ncbi:MAG: hypothetical protein O3C63_00400 [Cyanobacteria bacterium]|nr:hypothetical protein [Cyanobacteriota bacterium]
MILRITRHPAKLCFASDVDTEKVGTVRSTSSVSKDKEDFRGKYIRSNFHRKSNERT